MARIRSIKPEFPQSETIGKLSRDARLLFIQLWTIADDAGRVRAASRMLASLLYPYDDDAVKLIDKWLKELSESGCIRIYDVDGKKYLDIPKWLKHQKIDKPSKSRLPEYSANAREASSNAPRTLAPDLGSRTLDLGKDQKEDTAIAVLLPAKFAFECGRIRLTQKDFDQWKKAYPRLNLEAELLQLSQYAEEQGSKWFFAVSGALTKRDRDLGILEREKHSGHVREYRDGRI